MARRSSTTEPPVDVDVLRDEIQKTYTEVSTQPGEDFIFPTGRAWAEDLGYPQPELSNVPDSTVGSFAGVANPHSLGRIEEGATVLDLGCGAGTDLLIAAQMVGGVRACHRRRHNALDAACRSGERQGDGRRRSR